MKHEIMQRIEQIRRGETPKGYIRLHYYIIPAEWTEAQLSKLGMWVGGGTPSKSVSAYWHNGTIFWISSQEVKESIIRKTKYKITTRAVQESATTLVPPNTIVVVSRSGILQHTIPIAKTATSMAINQDIKALILNQSLDVDYVINAIKSKEETLLRKYTKKGTTVESLLFDAFSNFVIPYAPKEEREKIAAILTTQDKVIELKEKRLAEKQRQKKYLMQQLLTGKKRLPGFNKTWNTVELGEIFDYIQPTKYLVKTTDYDNAYKTPVLTAGKTFILGYTSETKDVYTNVPVVIFDDFTTATQYVDFPFKVKSSALKILAVKDGFNIFFAYEAMQLIRFAVGGHERHWISQYSCLTVDVPEIGEQTAIAQVLSTADREISLLRQGIEQEKQKKKALMQLLLTGIVRTTA